MARGHGSWFDLVIARDLRHGRITYPGPLDVVHAWAYVPDVAAAMVRLAERRATLRGFESFGFPGHAVTGADVGGAIAAALKQRFRVKRMEWWLIKTIGRLSALGRELAEIEYLWRTPHRISGEALTAVIGDVPHTPFADAVAASLRELGYGVPDERQRQAARCFSISCTGMRTKSLSTSARTASRSRGV